VLYDFAWELPDHGGGPDTVAEREEARARLTASSPVQGKNAG
jgi:hypothetical protein